MHLEVCRLFAPADVVVSAALLTVSRIAWCRLLPCQVRGANFSRVRPTPLDNPKLVAASQPALVRHGTSADRRLAAHWDRQTADTMLRRL